MDKLHYSAGALNDLDEIWEYIHNELQSPVAAQNVITGIMGSLEKLRDYPAMGSPLSSVIRLESDCRYFVCGKYTAFYRLDGTGVYIDRILYSRRDYLRILFDQ